VSEGFTGFPKQGVDWFRALQLSQRREWYQENKKAFELLWQEPMKALIPELKAPLQKVFGKKLGDEKIFRIFRDIRFSKDKSPFKTWYGALLPFAGFKDPMESPAALYFHLGLEETVAFGFYFLETPKVKRLRAAVLDDKTGGELVKLLATAKKAGLEVGAMESLKRPPPGVDPSHPRVELLKLKGLALTTKGIPKSVRFKASFKDWLVEQAAAAAPVLAWGFKQRLA